MILTCSLESQDYYIYAGGAHQYQIVQNDLKPDGNNHA